jgi:hypothetical protein
VTIRSVLGKCGHVPSASSSSVTPLGRSCYNYDSMFECYSHNIHISHYCVEVVIMLKILVAAWVAVTLCMSLPTWGTYRPGTLFTLLNVATS